MPEIEFREELIKTLKLILTSLNGLIRIMAYAHKSKLPKYLLRAAGIATKDDDKSIDD